MKFPTRPFVLYDTEFTTWEGAAARGWSGPNEYREIVQIGAIAVNEALEEVAELDLLVAPTLNPDLSNYFTNLTGITQAQVRERGKSFPRAVVQFAEWCQGLRAYSWGWDYAVLYENACLHDMRFFPFAPNQFADIRRLFNARGIPAVEYMSSTIPRAFGLEPPPDGHNALNDARSILMAMCALRDRDGSL